MKNCGTCKHWYRWRDDTHGKCEAILNVAGGVVVVGSESVTIPEPEKLLAYLAPEVLGYEESDLMTLETFGCVLWEAK